jgi:hypothetical protein
MALITNHTRLVGRAALAMIGIGLFGCGASGRSEAKVSGQVLLDGKPLRGGTVRLVSPEPGTPSVIAQIDESGNYGPVQVPVGEIMVSVDNRTLAPRAPRGAIPLPKTVNPEIRAKMAANRGTAAAPPLNPNYTPIPERYYLGETAGLNFRVEPGEQKHDIPLTSK